MPAKWLTHPTPDLLKKLGIPQGKVEALYRVPKPEEIEKPCKECGGLGFKGRTGVFELMIVDDKCREILVKQPKLDLLTKASPACRHAAVPGGRLAAGGQGRHLTRGIATCLKRVVMLSFHPLIC